MEKESEFKMFNPDEYELVMKAFGPEGDKHYIIHNKTTDKYGLLYNKKSLEDQSYYSPYLINTIGKKCGINVPDVELGYYIINDIDQVIPLYSKSFFQSSLVYTDIDPYMRNRVSHASQEIVDSTYLSENPIAAQKRSDEDRGRVQKINFKEYVESNLYYLLTRGTKTRQEYSRAEIDSIRQELVDRAMFGLKLGVKGKTNVDLLDHKNAKLSPYYLESRNMLLLGINNKWVESTLEESDEEFKKSMERELPTQFGIPYNYIVPTSEELLEHIYETYPEQAEKSYNKLKSFSLEDLKSELDSYTDMDDTHKKMALRIFELKDREFEKVHEKQARNRIQGE